MDNDSTFHITTTSILTALDQGINYTMGWTGMGKALGTNKNMLAKVRKSPAARKAWADVDVLIIKDCSLLSSFLIDVVDYLGKAIRKSTLPFGGIQIIMIGDLYGTLPQNTNSICCVHCGQSHKLSHQNRETVNEIGAHITCSNDLCGNSFINSWILYSFESSVWNDGKFLYFPLTKTFGLDAKIKELVSAVTSRESIENIQAIVKDQLCTEQELDSTPILCPTVEEANVINDSQIQALKGDFAKFEAVDIVLNNFDFTARAEQKEGPSEEVINLKIGAQVLVITEQTRSLESGTLIGYVSINDEEKKNIMKKQGHGIKQYEKSIDDWLAKNRMLPRVKMNTTGEIKTISCRVFAIHTTRRVVAWRVQIPLRLGYAVPMYKCHRMKLDTLAVTLKLTISCLQDSIGKLEIFCVLSTWLKISNP